jgi:hypothetical protein
MCRRILGKSGHDVTARAGVASRLFPARVAPAHSNGSGGNSLGYAKRAA